MKLLIIFFLVICIINIYAQQITEADKRQSDIEIEACAFENGINKKRLANIMKTGVVSGTKKLDCFSTCILQKTAVMNQDGTFDFTDANETKQSKICKKLKGNTKCETGGKVLECLLKHQIVPFG